jgi:group I intron endonuclease
MTDAKLSPSPELRSGIYSITCLQTGKVYVGQAMDIESRWNAHYQTLIAGTHENNYLQRAWIKYGPDAFAFEIIEIVEPQGHRIKLGIPDRMGRSEHCH